jgi:hypothetical protein
VSSITGTLTTIKTFLTLVSGTVTSTAVLITNTNKVLVSSLTIAGNLLNQSNKVLVGTLTVSGFVLNTSLKVLSASVSLTGNLVSLANKVLSGTVTSTATLIKSAFRYLTGTLTSSGVGSGQLTGQSLNPDLALPAINQLLNSFFLRKRTSTKTRYQYNDFQQLGWINTVLFGGSTQSISGTLTSSGAILKLVNKLLTGSLGPAAQLTKQLSKSFTATLTFSSSVQTLKAFVKDLVGTVSSSGNLLKTPKKLFTSSLSSSSLLVNLANKLQVSTLNLAGNLVQLKSSLVSASGTLSLAAVLIKQVNVLKSSTLTLSGALVKTNNKKFTGTLSISGVSGKVYSKLLTSSLSSSGILSKNSNVRLVSTLSTSAVSIKRLLKTFVSSLSFSSEIDPQLAGSYTKSLAGILFPTSFTPLPGRFHSSTLSISGVVSYVISPTQLKSVQGTFNSFSFLFKRSTKSFSGNYSVAGSLFKRTSNRQPTAILGLVGSYLGNLYKNFVGVITPSSELTTLISYVKELTGSFSFIGEIGNKYEVIINGTLNLTATTLAHVSDVIITSVLNLSGLVSRRYIKNLTSTLITSVSVIAQKEGTFSVNLGSVLHPVGSLLRRVNVSKVSTLFLAAVPTYSGRAVFSILRSSGIVTRRQIKANLSTLSLSGSLVTKVAGVFVTSLSGVLTPSGIIRRRLPFKISGVLFLSTVGILAKARSLYSVVAMSATLSGLSLKIKVLTGSLSTSGGLRRLIRLLEVSNLNPQKLIYKTAIKRFLSNLSPLQAFIIRTSILVPSSSLPLSGVTTPKLLGEIFSSLVSGTLSFTSTATTIYGKLFSGVLNTSSSIINRTGLTLISSISINTSLGKRKPVNVSSILNLIGSQGKQKDISVSGALSIITSFVTRKSRVSLSPSSVGFSNTLIRHIIIQPISSLMFVRSFLNRPNKAFVSVLTLVGTLSQLLQYSRILTSTLTSASVVIKRVSRSYVSNLSQSGLLVKRLSRSLISRFSFSGVIVRRTTKIVSSILSVTGISKYLQIRRLVSSLLTIGNFIKQARTSRTVSTLSSYSLLNRIPSLSGTVSTSGLILKSSGKLLSSSVSYAGSLGRLQIRPVTSTLDASSSIIKVGSKLTISTLNSTSIVRTFPTKVINSTILPVASYIAQGNGRVIVDLIGSVSCSSTIIYQTTKLTQGTLQYSSTLNSLINKRLSAVLGISKLVQVGRAFLLSLTGKVWDPPDLVTVVSEKFVKSKTVTFHNWNVSISRLVDVNVKVSSLTTTSVSLSRINEVEVDY